HPNKSPVDFSTAAAPPSALNGAESGPKKLKQQAASRTSCFSRRRLSLNVQSQESRLEAPVRGQIGAPVRGQRGSAARASLDIRPRDPSSTAGLDSRPRQPASTTQARQ